MFLFIYYHIIFYKLYFFPLLLGNTPEITTFSKGYGSRFLKQHILINQRYYYNKPNKVHIFSRLLLAQNFIHFRIYRVKYVNYRLQL